MCAVENQKWSHLINFSVFRSKNTTKTVDDGVGTNVDFGAMPPEMAAMQVDFSKNKKVKRTYFFNEFDENLTKSNHFWIYFRSDHPFFSLFDFSIFLIQFIKKWKNQKVQKNGHPTINKFKNDDFWYTSALQHHFFNVFIASNQ